MTAMHLQHGQATEDAEVLWKLTGKLIVVDEPAETGKSVRRIENWTESLSTFLQRKHWRRKQQASLQFSECVRQFSPFTW
jgi:hypothetical protein